MNNSLNIFVFHEGKKIVISTEHASLNCFNEFDSKRNIIFMDQTISFRCKDIKVIEKLDILYRSNAIVSVKSKLGSSDNARVINIEHGFDEEMYSCVQINWKYAKEVHLVFIVESS